MMPAQMEVECIAHKGICNGKKYRQNAYLIMKHRNKDLNGEKFVDGIYFQTLTQYRYSSWSLLQLDCNFQDPWKNKVEYLLRMLNQMLKNLPINEKDVVIYETCATANMKSIKHYNKKGYQLTWYLL